VDPHPGHLKGPGGAARRPSWNPQRQPRCPTRTTRPPPPVGDRPRPIALATLPAIRKRGPSGDLEQAFPTTFPYGEASDLAGVVTAIGRGVDSWAVGDGVLGWTDRRASHAEAVLVPADQLVAKPAGLW